MTFYVGVKKRRTWKISAMATNTDLDITEGLTLEWAFKFANGDLKKVVGTKNLTADTVTFLTPASLFTADRKGPCTHTIRIQESGSTGVDDLTKPIVEWVRDNIATPAQIEAIT